MCLCINTYIHTYTHIHSINPVSASDLQLDIEHVNKLDNTEHIQYTYTTTTQIMYKIKTKFFPHG